MDMFKTLPIAAEIIGGKKNTYLCMHGGISPNLKEKSDIDKVSRFVEPIKGLMFDLLWADPFEDDDFRKASFEHNGNRDCSWYFGIDPVAKLLLKGDYVAILRAHEV